MTDKERIKELEHEVKELRNESVQRGVRLAKFLKKERPELYKKHFDRAMSTMHYAINGEVDHRLHGSTLDYIMADEQLWDDIGEQWGEDDAPCIVYLLVFETQDALKAEGLR